MIDTLQCLCSDVKTLNGASSCVLVEDCFICIVMDADEENGRSGDQATLDVLQVMSPSSASSLVARSPQRASSSQRFTPFSGSPGREAFNPSAGILSANTQQQISPFTQTAQGFASDLRHSADAMTLVSPSTLPEAKGPQPLSPDAQVVYVMEKQKVSQVEDRAYQALHFQAASFEESQLELEDRAQAAADLRVKNLLAEASREHYQVVTTLLQRAQSETVTQKEAHGRECQEAIQRAENALANEANSMLEQRRREDQDRFNREYDKLMKEANSRLEKVSQERDQYRNNLEQSTQERDNLKGELGSQKEEVDLVEEDALKALDALKQERAITKELREQQKAFASQIAALKTEIASLHAIKAEPPKPSNPQPKETEEFNSSSSSSWTPEDQRSLMVEMMKEFKGMKEHFQKTDQRILKVEQQTNEKEEKARQDNKALKKKLAEARNENEQLQQVFAEVTQQEPQPINSPPNVREGYNPGLTPFSTPDSGVFGEPLRHPGVFRAEGSGAPAADAQPLPAEAGLGQGLKGLLDKTEPIKLKEFPSAIKFRGWKMQTRKTIIAASGRPAEVAAWLNEIDAATTAEELRPIQGTKNEVLDSKVAAAVSDILQGDFSRTIQVREEKAIKQDGLPGLGGRELLWWVYNHFKLKDTDGAMLEYRDLTNVTMKGDNLQAFINDWDYVMLGVKDVPGEKMLEEMFRTQLQKCSSMQTHMALYEQDVLFKRQVRSYENLRFVVDTLLEEKRQRSTRNQLYNKTGPFAGGAAGGATGDCHNWTRKGNCVNGDKCSWVHDPAKRGKDKKRGRTPPRGRDRGRSKSQDKRKSGQRSRSGSRSSKGSNRSRSGSQGKRRSFRGNASAASESKGPGLRGKSPSGRENCRPCMVYLKGKCEKGKACNYWHPPECTYFKRGNCNRGKKCVFRHCTNANPASRTPSLSSHSSKGSRGEAGSTPKPSPLPSPKQSPRDKSPGSAQKSTANSSGKKKSSPKKGGGALAGALTPRRTGLTAGLMIAATMVTRAASSAVFSVTETLGLEAGNGWRALRDENYWEEIDSDNENFQEVFSRNVQQGTSYLEETPWIFDNPADHVKFTMAATCSPQDTLQLNTYDESCYKAYLASSSVPLNVTFSDRALQVAERQESSKPTYRKNRAKRRNEARRKTWTIAEMEKRVKERSEWTALCELQSLHSAWNLSRQVFPRETSLEDEAMLFYNHGTARIGELAKQDRLFICDTGASYHIIGKKFMTRQEHQNIREADVPVILKTANGDIVANFVTDIYVKQLGRTVEAYVLKDSPPLISMGKLRREFGYRFYWEDEKPFIKRKDGTYVHCSTSQDVPFICPATPDGKPRGMPYILETYGKGKANPAGSNGEGLEKDSFFDDFFGGDMFVSEDPDPEEPEMSKKPPSPEAKPSKDREATKATPRSRARKRRRPTEEKLVCKEAKHNVFTHFPKCPGCDICDATKMQKTSARIVTGTDPEDRPAPKEFGDMLTADHKVMAQDEISKAGDKYALIIVDRFTKWLQAFPCKTKSTPEAKSMFQRFMGPGNSAKYVYLDGAGEFEKALNELEASSDGKWLHDKATPYRPQTNGVAERAVRKTKEGTSAALVQAGIGEEWWHLAMECFCYLHCIVDKGADNLTAYKRRYKVDFEGPIYPFGCAVSYLPSRDDEERIHSLGKKTLDGIFVGYELHAGGKWSGNLKILDRDAMATAETVHEVHPMIIRAPEVKPHLQGPKRDQFYFPLVDHEWEQPSIKWTDVSSRKSRAAKAREVENQEAEEADEGEDLGEISSDSGIEVDADPFAPESSADSWTFTGKMLVRNHRNPRSHMFVPRENNCPIPLKYLDIQRYTFTDIDGSAERYIEDNWVDPGVKTLSEHWTGKTMFDIMYPEPPPGKMIVGGRELRIEQTTRPDHLWPETWSNMSKTQRRKAQEWGRTEGVRYNRLREERGGRYVKAEDLDDYNKYIKLLKTSYALPPAPAMPVVSYAFSSVKGKPLAHPPEHEDKLADVGYASDTYFACVHVPIPIMEAKKIKAAHEALETEWGKLWKKKFIDPNSVCSKYEVQERAKKSGKTVHFGDLMELVHRKHAELEEKFHAYKGRVVFRGDNVKDEHGGFAVFTEQGTSASHLAAAKAVDAVARLPGCSGSDSDAIGAYTQVRLDKMDDTVETWVKLPLEQLRKLGPGWEKIDNPYVRLLVNLYGHPKAGLYWEIYSNKVLVKHGFEKVPGWESLWIHKKKQLIMSVYVDDYKLAGKTENLEPMWSSLSKDLDLEPFVPLHGSIYLGNKQYDVEIPEEMVAAKSQLIQNLLYRHRKIGESSKDSNHSTMRGVDHSEKSRKFGKVKGWAYTMQGHTEMSVQRYLELSGKHESSLKFVQTPCVDDRQFPPEDFETKGALSAYAARIVLKALYVARMNRLEFLWAVNSLARCVTKWTVACDKRLHRLVSYMHHHKDHVQLAWIGDTPDKIKVAMFVDASFAADLVDSKSTTGAYIVLIGPNTFVPLNWICKKHGATSHSSTESEVIALEAALRMEGLPMLSLWSLISKIFGPGGPDLKESPIKKLPEVSKLEDYLERVDYVPPTMPELDNIGELIIFEDNEACIRIVVKGRSPSLRHINRTHRVDLDWVFERVKNDPGVSIKFCTTKEQMGDIFTKGSFTGTEWRALCTLANIVQFDLTKTIDTVAKTVKKIPAVGTGAGETRSYGGNLLTIKPLKTKLKITGNSTNESINNNKEKQDLKEQKPMGITTAASVAPAASSASTVAPAASASASASVSPQTQCKMNCWSRFGFELSGVRISAPCRGRGFCCQQILTVGSPSPSSQMAELELERAQSKIQKERMSTLWLGYTSSIAEAQQLRRDNIPSHHGVEAFQVYVAEAMGSAQWGCSELLSEHSVRIGLAAHKPETFLEDHEKICDLIEELVSKGHMYCSAKSYLQEVLRFNPIREIFHNFVDIPRDPFHKLAPIFMRLGYDGSDDHEEVLIIVGDSTLKQRKWKTRDASKQNQLYFQGLNSNGNQKYPSYLPKRYKTVEFHVCPDACAQQLFEAALEAVLKHCTDPRNFRGKVVVMWTLGEGYANDPDTKLPYKNWQELPQTMKVGIKNLWQFTIEVPNIVIIGSGLSESWDLTEEFDQLSMTVKNYFEMSGKNFFSFDSIYRNMARKEGANPAKDWTTLEIFYSGIQAVIEVDDYMQAMLLINTSSAEVMSLCTSFSVDHDVLDHEPHIMEEEAKKRTQRLRILNLRSVRLREANRMPRTPEEALLASGFKYGFTQEMYFISAAPRHEDSDPLMIYSDVFGVDPLGNIPLGQPFGPFTSYHLAITARLDPDLALEDGDLQYDDFHQYEFKWLLMGQLPLNDLEFLDSESQDRANGFGWVCMAENGVSNISFWAANTDSLPPLTELMVYPWRICEVIEFSPSATVLNLATANEEFKANNDELGFPTAIYNNLITSDLVRQILSFRPDPVEIFFEQPATVTRSLPPVVEEATPQVPQVVTTVSEETPPVTYHGTETPMPEAPLPQRGPPRLLPEEVRSIPPGLIQRDIANDPQAAAVRRPLSEQEREIPADREYLAYFTDDVEDTGLSIPMAQPFEYQKRFRAITFQTIPFHPKFQPRTGLIYLFKPIKCPFGEACSYGDRCHLIHNREEENYVHFSNDCCRSPKQALAYYTLNLNPNPDAKFFSLALLRKASIYLESYLQYAKKEYPKEDYRIIEEATQLEETYHTLKKEMVLLERQMGILDQERFTGIEQVKHEYGVGDIYYRINYFIDSLDLVTANKGDLTYPRVSDSDVAVASPRTQEQLAELREHMENAVESTSENVSMAAAQPTNTESEAGTRPALVQGESLPPLVPTSPGTGSNDSAAEATSPTQSPGEASTSEEPQQTARDSAVAEDEPFSSLQTRQESGQLVASSNVMILREAEVARQTQLVNSLVGALFPTIRKKATQGDIVPAVIPEGAVIGRFASHRETDRNLEPDVTTLDEIPEEMVDLLIQQGFLAEEIFGIPEMSITELWHVCCTVGQRALGVDNEITPSQQTYFLAVGFMERVLRYTHIPPERWNVIQQLLGPIIIKGVASGAAELRKELEKPPIQRDGVPIVFGPHVVKPFTQRRPGDTTETWSLKHDLRESRTLLIDMVHRQKDYWSEKASQVKAYNERSDSGVPPGGTSIELERYMGYHDFFVTLYFYLSHDQIRDAARYFYQKIDSRAVLLEPGDMHLAATLFNKWFAIHGDEDEKAELLRNLRGTASAASGSAAASAQTSKAVAPKTGIGAYTEYDPEAAGSNNLRAMTERITREIQNPQPLSGAVLTSATPQMDAAAVRDIRHSAVKASMAVNVPAVKQPPAPRKASAVKSTQGVYTPFKATPDKASLRAQIPEVPPQAVTAPIPLHGHGLGRGPPQGPPQPAPKTHKAAGRGLQATLPAWVTHGYEENDDGTNTGRTKAEPLPQWKGILERPPIFDAAEIQALVSDPIGNAGYVPKAPGEVNVPKGFSKHSGQGLPTDGIVVFGNPDSEAVIANIPVPDDWETLPDNIKQILRVEVAKAHNRQIIIENIARRENSQMPPRAKFTSPGKAEMSSPPPQLTETTTENRRIVQQGMEQAKEGTETPPPYRFSSSPPRTTHDPMRRPVAKARVSGGGSDSSEGDRTMTAESGRSSGETRTAGPSQDPPISSSSRQQGGRYEQGSGTGPDSRGQEEDEGLFDAEFGPAPIQFDDPRIEWSPIQTHYDEKSTSKHRRTFAWIIRHSNLRDPATQAVAFGDFREIARRRFPYTYEERVPRSKKYPNGWRTRIDPTRYQWSGDEELLYWVSCTDDPKSQYSSDPKYRKGRYEVGKIDGRCVAIRAFSGQSGDQTYVDPNTTYFITSTTELETAWHATTPECWENILENGIYPGALLIEVPVIRGKKGKNGRRESYHSVICPLYPGQIDPESVNTRRLVRTTYWAGKRRTFLIEFDVALAMTLGSCTFYQKKNHALHTCEVIPKEAILRIVDSKSGIVVYVKPGTTNIVKTCSSCKGQAYHDFDSCPHCNNDYSHKDSAIYQKMSESSAYLGDLVVDDDEDIILAEALISNEDSDLIIGDKQARDFQERQRRSLQQFNEAHGHATAASSSQPAPQQQRRASQVFSAKAVEMPVPASSESSSSEIMDRDEAADSLVSSPFQRSRESTLRSSTGVAMHQEVCPTCYKTNVMGQMSCGNCGNPLSAQLSSFSPQMLQARSKSYRRSLSEDESDQPPRKSTHSRTAMATEYRMALKYRRWAIDEGLETIGELFMKGGVHYERFQLLGWDIHQCRIFDRFAEENQDHVDPRNRAHGIRVPKQRGVRIHLCINGHLDPTFIHFNRLPAHCQPGNCSFCHAEIHYADGGAYCTSDKCVELDQDWYCYDCACLSRDGLRGLVESWGGVTASDTGGYGY